MIAGPQCVPRKIYSIAMGASRSQLFVAVEGTGSWPASVLTESVYSICISCQDRVTDGVFQCIHSLSSISPSCQRVLVCASSVVVQLAPAPCRASTVRAARSFILKGPLGWTPAVSAAAWWKWGPTHLKNILLALCARGMVWMVHSRNYIYLSTVKSNWRFYAMLFHTSAPLYFRGKYCTFNSNYIYLIYILVTN